MDKVFLPVGFCFDVIDGKRLVVYSGYDNCETAFGHVLAYDVPALGCCSVTLPDVKVGSVDVGFLAAVRSASANRFARLTCPRTCALSVTMPFRDVGKSTVLPFPVL